MDRERRGGRTDVRSSLRHGHAAAVFRASGRFFLMAFVFALVLFLLCCRLSSSRMPVVGRVLLGPPIRDHSAAFASSRLGQEFLVFDLSSWRRSRRNPARWDG
jgi:hypothetical protein